MTTDVPPLAPAVAAHGLPGAKSSWPDRAVEPSVWASLLSLARHQRITGLLASAIVDGALPATDAQKEEAQLTHRASMVTVLNLEACLVRVSDLLGRAGIDHRVLKGPAVAHLDFPDPALRSFGDIDLLVRSSQFEDTVAELAAAGHQRKYPEPRPGFDRRFGKGSCLVGPDGHEIDLHRTFTMGPYGVRVDLDDLWSRSSGFDLAGRRLQALGPEERFLHGCFHAALGDNPPRLVSLRDVAQMHLTRPLDAELVRTLSRSWRADAVVSRAVQLATEGLGLQEEGPLTDWAMTFTPSDQDRRFLAAYSATGQSYAAKSFAAIRAVPGIRNKVAFVFSLVLPTRAYLEERREQPSHRWRRGLEEVRRVRRPR